MTSLLTLLGLCSPVGAEIKTIWVVQASHSDVGFNAPPSVMQERNYDRTIKALNIADNQPDFRWTIETAYQLRNFLERAAPEDIERLRQRLVEGRFDFGANYMNLHSGISGAAEIERLVDRALEYAERLGVTPGPAMLNDVPGFTWALPDVFANHGIRHAVLGPNAFIGGDPIIPLAHRPFWWEGAGGGRVLTWRTYGSYAEGYLEWGLLNLDNMRRKLPERVAEFEAAGYPYEEMMVLRMFDDETPSSAFLHTAAIWNATETPKVRLATPREFFAQLEEKYGDVFPVYRGDASGFWESAAALTPASAAIVRRARARLDHVQKVWRDLASEHGAGYPAETIAEAWDLIMLVNEHSNGGVGWPGLLEAHEVRRENQEFVAATRTADRLVDQLESDARTAIAIAQEAGEAGLILTNAYDEPFSGVVELDAPGPQPADLRLVDRDTGKTLTFRWTRDDRSSIAFQTTVAAGGQRRWRVLGGGTTPAPPSRSAGDSLLVDDLELVVDPATGTVTSLFELSSGTEWIGASNGHRFAGLEWGDNARAFFGVWEPRFPEEISVLVEEPSPVFRRLIVVGPHREPLYEYRLFESERRLDVRLIVRRSRIPYVPFADHSHHYAIAFPAELETPTSLHVDGPGGWFAPGPESLPGVSLSHFGSSTGARIEGANGRWMSMTSLDSVLVMLGEQQGYPAPQLETDETTMTWLLDRHSDEGQVRSGLIVQFEAEPSLPDVTSYEFVIRFGEADDEKPTREQMQGDMAPPLAVWHRR